MTKMKDPWLRAIEDDAQHMVLPPSIMGEEVAWVMTSSGHTSGLSAIHRYYEQGATFCSHPVPDVKRLLSIPLVRPSLKRCSRCDTMAARVTDNDTEPVRAAS